MIEKIKALLVRYKSVILYVIFGGLTTVIDFGTSFVLYAVWGEALEAHRFLAHGADVIAWVAAVLFSFFTNRIWVFESKRKGFAIFLELLSFAGGRVITLLLQEGLIAIFFTWLGLNIYAVRLGAGVFVVIINYFVSKWLVFRNKNPEQPQAPEEADNRK